MKTAPVVHEVNDGFLSGRVPSGAAERMGTLQTL
jgi:hypothetical protein